MTEPTRRDYERELADLLLLAAAHVPRDVAVSLEESRAQLAAAQQPLHAPQIVISHEGTLADP